MLSSAEKCKCLLYGYNNKHYDNVMGKERIETTDEERDLKIGVIVLGVTKQYVRAANANAMLGIINRASEHNTNEVAVKLYEYLIGLHLDFCIQAWRPFKQ